MALSELIQWGALDTIIDDWSNWRHHNSGFTVIHTILDEGSVELLRRAVKSPLVSLLDTSDYSNKRPLWYAVHKRDYVRVCILLQAGASTSCYSEHQGWNYITFHCPFALTVGDHNLDMAILLLTAQGHPFPDGHDRNCCKSMVIPSSIPPSFAALMKPDPKTYHLERCEKEMEKRKKRAMDVFIPFLFHLKKRTHRDVYRDYFLPLMKQIYSQTRYGACRK